MHGGCCEYNQWKCSGLKILPLCIGRLLSHWRSGCSFSKMYNSQCIWLLHTLSHTHTHTDTHTHTITHTYTRHTPHHRTHTPTHTHRHPHTHRHTHTDTHRHTDTQTHTQAQYLLENALTKLFHRGFTMERNFGMDFCVVGIGCAVI